MLSKIVVLLANLFIVKSENIYNYYELAVQKGCSLDYMIHGLWPQINSTAYPENCKTVSYTKPTGDLLTNMNTYLLLYYLILSTYTITSSSVPILLLYSTTFTSS